MKNILRSKPRFKIITESPKEDIENFVKKFLAEKREEFHCNINREMTIIWVNTTHNNYWKPYLSLRTETEDEKTVLRGIFGPSAAVWTFFMFLYFIFGVTFMVFISIWWVARQINSPDFPYALTVSILALAFMAFTYLSTKIGQKLASKEIEKLKNLVEENFYSL